MLLEKRTSAIERELIALLAGVRKWSSYIQYARCTIYVGHPVTLAAFKGQAGSMKARAMALELSMYEFGLELAPPGIEWVHSIPV